MIPIFIEWICIRGKSIAIRFEQLNNTEEVLFRKRLYHSDINIILN